MDSRFSVLVNGSTITGDGINLKTLSQWAGLNVPINGLLSFECNQQENAYNGRLWGSKMSLQGLLMKDFSADFVWHKKTYKIDLYNCNSPILAQILSNNQHKWSRCVVSVKS